MEVEKNEKWSYKLVVDKTIPRKFNNGVRSRAMQKILAIIGGLILITGFIWGIFTYLERYALCEDVKKVDQKVEKTMEMMQYSFKEFQLESKEKRISEIEKKAGKSPKDPIVAETLEQLRKDKVKLEKEMRKIEEKK